LLAVVDEDQYIIDVREVFEMARKEKCF